MVAGAAADRHGSTEIEPATPAIITPPIVGKLTADQRRHKPEVNYQGWLLLQAFSVNCVLFFQVKIACKIIFIDVLI